MAATSLTFFQYQAVTDRATSSYASWLLIDGPANNIAATYRCSVANEFGSSSRDITIQGVTISAPDVLIVGRPSTLTCSTDLHSNGIEWIVGGVSLGSLPGARRELILESGPVLAVMSVSVQSLHTVLHGLESDTVYYYSIVGTNTAGRSESAVMSFQTNQISGQSQTQSTDNSGVIGGMVVVVVFVVCVAVAAMLLTYCMRRKKIRYNSTNRDSRLFSTPLHSNHSYTSSIPPPSVSNPPPSVSIPPHSPPTFLAAVYATVGEPTYTHPHPSHCPDTIPPYAQSEPCGKMTTSAEHVQRVGLPQQQPEILLEATNPLYGLGGVAGGVVEREEEPIYSWIWEGV